MEATVRLLTPDDAEAWAALRLEMLLDSPGAFSSSPEDDFRTDVAVVRERLAAGPQSVTFGAFTSELIGAVGILRERKLKIAHRTMVWGMFVTPAQRGRGVGRRLLRAAVDHARALDGVSQVNLSVSESAPEASALYEAAGFRVWGTEPGSLCVDGRPLAEIHLVLRLDEEGAP